MLKVVTETSVLFLSSKETASDTAPLRMRLVTQLLVDVLYLPKLLFSICRLLGGDTDMRDGGVNHKIRAIFNQFLLWLLK